MGVKTEPSRGGGRGGGPHEIFRLRKKRRNSLSRPSTFRPDLYSLSNNTQTSNCSITALEKSYQTKSRALTPQP